MYKTINNDIQNVANTETLVVAVTGIPDRRRVVKEIHFEQGAGLIVRAYVDQERIVDYPSENAQAPTNPIPVDLELKPGQEFRVGHNETAGGTTLAHITVIMEESQGYHGSGSGRFAPHTDTRYREPTTPTNCRPLPYHRSTRAEALVVPYWRTTNNINPDRPTRRPDLHAASCRSWWIP